MTAKWLVVLNGLFVTAVCLTLGCQDAGIAVTDGRLPQGSYRYEGFDAKGASIVTGVMTFSAVDSVIIKGEWALKKTGASSDGIGPQVGAGLLTGTIEGNVITVNLNPGWADNNVVLRGIIDQYRILGTWVWITFAGPTTEGTFRATKVP